MRLLLISLLITFTVSCASMPGMPGNVSTTESDFDGSKQVEMEPANVVEPGALVVPFNLGAKWTTEAPEHVWIVVSIPGTSADGYASIQSRDGLQFNIDGDIVKVSSQDVVTDLEGDVIQGVHHQESSKAFIADLGLLRRIVDSDMTKAKVITADGYLEGRLESGVNSALDGFERFLTEVDKVKK